MIYQLITYQFLHGGFIHILFNMLALLSLGPDVEEHLSTKKFIIYYLLCGVASGLFNSFMTGENIPMIGASGSIWGIIVMFTFLFPNVKLNLIFIPIGIKAKWLIGFLAFIEIYACLQGVSDGTAHFGHVGGGLMGLILIIYELYIKKYIKNGSTLYKI